MTADERFEEVARELGHRFDGELRVGGNYVPVRRHGDLLFVAGQIPRVGDAIVVTGRAGGEVDLAAARRGAAICAMRALALLRRSVGTLEHVAAVVRVGVYVSSAEGFTQQSEVADGASEVLRRVLGEAGAHARTSVGVSALPKNATVELELVAAARPPGAVRRPPGAPAFA
jgi:enamine deaminase RidA (YjgF/YER057c/UK114 family)